MTRVRRIVLWAAVLSPLVLIPGAFLSARMWLNHHLKRELTLGDIRIRLIRPALGWNLDFAADSVAVDAPRFSLRAGRVAADLRLWNSVASLKPDLRVGFDTVRVRVEPDTVDSLKSIRKRELRAPTFPNVRIPIAFRVAADRLELFRGAKAIGAVLDPAVYSQGPKGAAVEASGVALPRAGDSSALVLGKSLRASARWFGRSVRYQARVEDSSGGYARLEGERRKSDLRVGRDSLEAALTDFSAYAALYEAMGKETPEFRNVDLKAAVETGEHDALRVRAVFIAPKVWLLDPQQVELTVAVEDSSGRLVINADGPAGERAYLQGQFQLPYLKDGKWGRIPEALTANLSGYTRDFRFRIGRRILPGDAEIRRVKIFPGLDIEADVRTRDSSLIHLHAYRGDSVSTAARFAARKDVRAGRNAGVGGNGGGDRVGEWRCDLGGTIGVGEAWAHTWTDSNVVYSAGKVKGLIDKRGVQVEAWVKDPQAYGTAGDSVYAAQHINSKGYYLDSARVYAKELVWPVSGRVEWGVKPKDAQGHRQVSLEFKTKHARYGSVDFAMPNKTSLQVRVDSLAAEFFPYAKLPKLTALKPVATGSFQWDWAHHTGSLDAQGSIRYRGEDLGLSAQGNWDVGALEIPSLEIAFAGAKLRCSAGLRLGGGAGLRDWRSLSVKNVKNLSLEAHDFDASRLSVFLGEAYPVERGVLDGRLDYADSSGFSGTYAVRDLELGPIRKLVSIPRAALVGRGEGITLAVRTASTAYPWLNDTLSATVGGVLGQMQSLDLRASSDDGLNVRFQGASREFRDLEGIFHVDGKASLPGQAGEIRDVRLGGHFATPFTRDLLSRMTLDSGGFSGRYAIPGLDTEAFNGTLGIRDGRLRIPDLHATDGAGLELTGEADCEIAGAPVVTAKLRGENVALRWPGVQKLMLKNADASLKVDSTGLSATARVGRAEFASSRPPVTLNGSLEDFSLDYTQPPAPKTAKGAPPAAAPVPQLRAYARLRDFLFKHKIGYREVQRSIRTAKSEKRKKRVKPVDVQLNLETAGSNNRVETDILRMAFTGDLAVKGTYPYLLLSGQFSSLHGELGQTNLSYDVTDFDLKWQNATVEEGRISVDGSKRLRADCKPDTKRTCNVFVKLAGQLDEMNFTYDTDCGSNSGESIEPTALINSVSRGCYSDEFVAGAGNSGYGEAVVALLEPTLSENLSKVTGEVSRGWIKRTTVSGIGTAVSGDTTGNEPIAVSVESKEKFGVSFMAEGGYHPEKKVQNPWEGKAGMEWKLPLEKAANNSEWKRLVRDRVTLEASALNRPEEKITEDNSRDVRKEVGIHYHYTFWDLW